MAPKKTNHYLGEKMKVAKIISPIVALITLSMATSAFAERARLVLEFNDLHFKGGRRGAANILKLKKEIKNQYPGIQLRNADLIRVRLVAKSKHGQGTAALHVGRHSTYEERIYGSSRDFHNRDSYTYDKIKINNPSYNSEGQWQLHFRGNIKIKQVAVVVNLDSDYRETKTQTLFCGSFGRFNAECEADGQIVDISIISEYKNRCVKHSNYGFYGNKIWVSKKCRAIFQVTYLKEGGYNQPPRRKPPGQKPPRRRR